MPELPACNMLATESSPYLVQHANNPVHWRAWSKQALDEARSSGKPVLVSIGYAACHWCHVMAHESFDDPAIAALMNELFVNIKVDREERPDIDQIYMSALHAMGEQGGWPLTIFTDADGIPFWGGTYFPPEARYGRPGFPDILKAISRAWREDPARITSNTKALARHLGAQSVSPGETPEPVAKQFDLFAAAVLDLADQANGGLRGAPKFPNAPMTETWARASRTQPQNDYAAAFVRTIERMSLGGIYDHIAGGLSRYSVDDIWLVPHFEKMLYDNAHYLRHLGWAWQITGDDLFRLRIEQTMEWLSREMLLPEGAFASSLDADSEGAEGKYYTWSKKEIAAILGKRTNAFCDAYGITEAGNFEAANIPNMLHIHSRAQAVALQTEFAEELELLLGARSRRTPPARDDKILTDWNGYLVRAIAELGFIFQRQDWTESAATAFDYIVQSIADGSSLCHSYRNGVAVRPALATDYAAMANAAITLTERTGKPDYLDRARAWFDLLESDYRDNSGGFHLTSIDADTPLLRPRCDIDEANPSAASQILEAFTRYSQLTGEQSFLDKAWRLAANLNSITRNASHGAAGSFNAFHSLHNHRHVRIFSTDRKNAAQFLEIIRKTPAPEITFTVSTKHKPAKYISATLQSPHELPAAIICTAQSCSSPVVDLAEFEARLNSR
jgi:uncharacterized protein